MERDGYSATSSRLQNAKRSERAMFNFTHRTDDILASLRNECHSSRTNYSPLGSGARWFVDNTLTSRYLVLTLLVDEISTSTKMYAC